MKPITFTINNVDVEVDSAFEQNRLKFESFLNNFESIQSKLEGTEVSGEQYGGLLLLNNLIISLDALNQSYINNNSLSTLTLNRHFSELFMDIRVTIEDLSSKSLYTKERISQNLKNYAGLILWKEMKFHNNITKEHSLNNEDPLDGEIIDSSKTMETYYNLIIKELGLTSFVDKIENRKERRVPTYRYLVIQEDRKHTAYNELLYPWSKIEYKRDNMVAHAEYDSLFISDGKCIGGNVNINFAPLLINSQLSKLEAIESWIIKIYRTVWPKIAWGKLYNRVNFNLKD